MAKTIFDKVWDKHVVDSISNGPSVLYIDKHLIHEVTSPQAFADLEESMCRRDPRFGTVSLLVNTPSRFETYGHTPSGKFSGARGNLKNREFSTF